MEYQMEYARSSRDVDSPKEVKEPLKEQVQGECPKCSQTIRLTITNTTFHCHACGFIQYSPFEEKPMTLEMINRPAWSKGMRGRVR